MPTQPINSLTTRQRHLAFARAFVFTHAGNATRAAIAASYSPRSAGQAAYRLMKKESVRALIEQMEKRAAAKAEINPNTVIQELGKLALSNIADFVDDDGQFAGMVGLTRDQTAAIQELEIDPKTGRRKIKLANKRESLELLAKHFKLLGADDHGVGNQIQVIVVNSPRPERTSEMVGQATVEAISEAIDVPTDLEDGPPPDVSED